jgi:hypothetical protein
MDAEPIQEKVRYVQSLVEYPEETASNEYKVSPITVWVVPWPSARPTDCKVKRMLGRESCVDVST